MDETADSADPTPSTTSTTTPVTTTTSTSTSTTTEAPDPNRLEVGLGDLVEYGDAPQQVGQLRLPIGQGDGPFPVIAFIHGGFWRNAFNNSLSEPQAADARAKGYATWNIEYRRVGDPGGGYPGTLDDIGTAIDALARIDAPLDLDRVFVVGHSAGGHLALWVGQRDDPVVVPRLVVGQAPVADLGGSLNLGRGAVETFMGGLPAELPDAYAAADPARRLPVKVPQLIVHGLLDDIVPFSVVAPYIDEAGDGVDTLLFETEGHFDVIDPMSASWEATLAYLESI
ncbi:MAG: alpha/beta hydrolase [Actinomycetota bacterium]